MSDAEETRAAQEGEAESEIAPTPFDNPFFLPVVLLGFAVWCLYDGFFNPETKSVTFNRVMTFVFGLPGLYYAVRAVRERRAKMQRA